jgi:hypothetical protein
MRLRRFAAVHCQIEPTKEINGIFDRLPCLEDCFTRVREQSLVFDKSAPAKWVHGKGNRHGRCALRLDRPILKLTVRLFGSNPPEAK